MFRLAGNRIGPTLLTTYVTCVTIQVVLRIISMTGCHQELIDNIGIILYLIIAKCIFCIKGSTHINAIQPYLIRINLLMPKTTVCIAGMLIKLTSHQSKRFLVFLIFCLFVNAEYKLAGVDAVKTVFLTFVHFDSTVGIYHRIGIG